LRNLNEEEELDKPFGNRTGKKSYSSISARPDALAISPIRKKLYYTQRNHISKGSKAV